MKIFLTTLLIAVFFSAGALAEVNINTASEQELADSLKNIGLKKALAIVEYRKANGDFKSVEDLANVAGIGKVTVEINRTMLTTNTKQKNVKRESSASVAEEARSVAAMEP